MIIWMPTAWIAADCFFVATQVLCNHRYIRRWHMCLADSFFSFFSAGFLLLYVKNDDRLFTVSMFFAAGIALLWGAWRHRNKDDDNHRGKKLKAKLKAKIKKPVIAAIRPIQQGV